MEKVQELKKFLAFCPLVALSNPNLETHDTSKIIPGYFETYCSYWIQHSIKKFNV
jgi:hypothetical protein